MAVAQTSTVRQHKCSNTRRWFLFPHRQNYDTESTAPRLKYLLFHRAEYETTALSSVGKETVSTDFPKYKDIYC